MAEHDSAEPNTTDPAALESLQERLQRLESAIASMQDVRAIEERVTERVRQQIEPVIKDGAARTEDRIADSKYRTKSSPRLPAVAPDLPLPASLNALRHSWLIIDMWRDLVVIVRMFLDVRYHVGWLTRMAVLVLVPVILTSHWWSPLAYVPFVGDILDKLSMLLLAFFLYQALSREAFRYRTWKAQIPLQ